MQNEKVSIEPSIVSAKIINGVLTGFELFASDDTGTLPASPGQRIYTFTISVFGSNSYQTSFKTWVPHSINPIDVTELVERSGMLGIPTGGRPVLLAGASNSAIIDALRFLGLVEVTPQQPGAPTYFQQ